MEIRPTEPSLARRAKQRFENPVGQARRLPGSGQARRLPHRLKPLLSDPEKVEEPADDLLR